MDLTVRVLTTGYWPGAANSNCVCNIPIPPRLSFEHFKGYFTLLYFTLLHLPPQPSYLHFFVLNWRQSIRIYEYLYSIQVNLVKFLSISVLYLYLLFFIRRNSWRLKYS